jgi:hypothetical protein
MNADGTPVTEPCFINTHELLVSEDFEDCVGSLHFLFIPSITCPVYYLSYLICFSLFLFAGKMKDLHDRVNEASKNGGVRMFSLGINS